MLCDWLAKLAPLSQPMRSKTKTNRALLGRVFPRFTPVGTFASNSDWFIALSTFVVIGQTNYFGFGYTILNQKRAPKYNKHH